MKQVGKDCRLHTDSTSRKRHWSVRNPRVRPDRGLKMSTQPSRIARPQSSHVIGEAPIKSAPDPAQMSHVSSSNDQVGAVTPPNLARPVEIGVDSKVHLESLLDSEEAGRFLRIHPVTVKRLARSGRLPGFRIGNRWRFRFSDLDDWAHSTVLSQHSLRRE
jgi:excisionase family DNA binding protein